MGLSTRDATPYGQRVSDEGDLSDTMDDAHLIASLQLHEEIASHAAPFFAGA